MFSPKRDSLDLSVKPEPDPACMICANEILVDCMMQHLTTAEKIAVDARSKEHFDKAYGELTSDEMQKLIERLPPADLQLSLAKYSRKCFIECVGKCRERGICSDVMYDTYAGDPLPSSMVTPQIDLKAIEQDAAAAGSGGPGNSWKQELDRKEAEKQRQAAAAQARAEDDVANTEATAIIAQLRAQNKEKQEKERLAAAAAQESVPKEVTFAQASFAQAQVTEQGRVEAVEKLARRLQ